MKNESSWLPSKFVLVDGRLGANTDARYVSVASRLNVNLLAGALQRVVLQYAQGRLLDLGCGRVPLYGVYRQRVSEVLCVDWGQSGHDTGHVDLEADLNEPLQIASAQFDTVILTDVLEHIAKPGLLMSEVRRVLRVGGVLLGSVPFLYRLHEEPHDHYRYTAHSLRRLAQEHGLAVEMLEPYGVGTDVLFDTLGKILLSLRWRYGGKLARWTQVIGQRAHNASFIKELNGRHESMPLGYVFVFRAH